MKANYEAPRAGELRGQSMDSRIKGAKHRMRVIQEAGVKRRAGANCRAESPLQSLHALTLRGSFVTKRAASLALFKYSQVSC